MDCRQAILAMMTYVLSGEKSAIAENSCFEQAVKHTVRCKRCIEDLDLFIALMEDKPLGLQDKVIQFSLCWKCQEGLAAYIDKELYRENDDEEMASIRAHLELCPDCREQYETTKEMVIAEARGLLGTSRKANHQLWKTIGEGGQKFATQVKELTMQIVVTLEKSKAINIVDSLVLQPLWFTSALAMRDKALTGLVPEEAEGLIPLPDEEGGIQVNMMLKATDDGQVNVTVEVVNLKTVVPIEGVQVILFERAEGEERILQALNTGELGEVSFSLSPEQYVVQVSHARRVLRFPIGIECSK